MPPPKLTHYLGPLNKAYGYSIEYAAPIEQVRAASKKSGKEMWDALEECDWQEVSELNEKTIGGTHVDGDTLRLSPVPFDFEGEEDEDDDEGDDEEEE